MINEIWVLYDPCADISLTEGVHANEEHDGV